MATYDGSERVFGWNLPFAVRRGDRREACLEARNGVLERLKGLCVRIGEDLNPRSDPAI